MDVVLSPGRNQVGFADNSFRGQLWRTAQQLIQSIPQAAQLFNNLKKAVGAYYAARAVVEAYAGGKIRKRYRGPTYPLVGSRNARSGLRRKRRKFKRKFSKRKFKKRYSSLKTKVLNIINPPAMLTEDYIVSYPIPVNKKSYIDASFYGHGEDDLSPQGVIGRIKDQIAKLIMKVPTWEPYNIERGYFVTLDEFYYEVTNLSNSPIWFRAHHWLAKENLEFPNILETCNDWIHQNPVLFPDETTAGAELLVRSSTHKGRYDTSMVLNDVMTLAAIKKRALKDYKITSGKEVMIPPQGVVKLYDKVRGRRFFRENDHYFKMDADNHLILDVIRNWTRGFIFSFCGETARGADGEGVPTASHAVALPGYVAIHVKTKFVVQTQPQQYAVSSYNYTNHAPTPVNATPVIFGSENNAATKAT